MTEENNQDKNQNKHDSVEPESESVPPISYEVDSIPGEAMEFRQSHWAWLMPSSLWIGVLAIVIFIDFISMGIIPLLLCAGIAGPRYLRWRQTVYYVSEDSLYLTMVGLPVIQKPRTFQIPFESIAQLVPKHGSFGRTLAYAEVGIKFKDERMAKLSYMSEYDTFMTHIKQRTTLDTEPERTEPTTP